VVLLACSSAMSVGRRTIDQGRHQIDPSCHEQPSTPLVHLFVDEAITLSAGEGERGLRFAGDHRHDQPRVRNGHL
jgi:hypothetical protein